MLTDGVVVKVHGACSAPRPEHVVLGSSPGVVRDFFILKVFGRDNQNTLNNRNETETTETSETTETRDILKQKARPLSGIGFRPTPQISTDYLSLLFS